MRLVFVAALRPLLGRTLGRGNRRALIAFGLAHGLVDALPLLVALGAGLAWLRSKSATAMGTEVTS